MLYAELHGKLSSEIGDAERREDVLTSTVFGTLFAASAWNVVIEWLSKAGRAGSDPPLVPSDASMGDYWFWPRLDNAEPDLVVRLGHLLVVVEAKDHSGKSGTLMASEDPTEDPADQLVREWRACSPAADMSHYDPRLRAVLEAPATERILIYLVRRSRFAREHDALEDSMAQVPDARMYLLTWEDLDEVLSTCLHIRWANDLRRYLQRRDVSAFRGFAQCVSSSPLHTLHAWTRDRSPARPDFVRAFQRLRLTSFVALASRPSTFAHEVRGWKSVMSAESLTLIRRLSTHPSRFPER